MDNSSKVKELIRQIAGTETPQAGFYLMEVVSVEGDLCVAKIDDLVIRDIRLSAIVGGSENGILVTPSENSIILVADLSGGFLRDFAVVGFSEIDSIRIHKNKTTVITNGEVVNIEVGSSKVEIVDDKITFNEGDLGGMLKIKELTNKLNALKDSVNSLVQSYNSHVHATPAGAALPVTEAEKAEKAVAFVSSQYEDDKIIH